MAKQTEPSIYYIQSTEPEPGFANSPWRFWLGGDGKYVSCLASHGCCRAAEKTCAPDVCRTLSLSLPVLPARRVRADLAKYITNTRGIKQSAYGIADQADIMAP